MWLKFEHFPVRKVCGVKERRRQSGAKKGEYHAESKYSLPL